jgi:flagellar hook-associated protein 1 FlgK
MSFEGLYISRSGIAASQRALDVIGHNIANVSTPGHSRQRVEQASIERAGPSLILGPGANGEGIRINAVTRVRDLVLDAGVRSELSNSGSAEVSVATLSKIEQALGPYADGLGEALTAFWNGWEELSLDPTSATARAQVLDAAEALSRSVQQASVRVTAVQDNNIAAAASMIETQNAAIEEIAHLNGEIKAQIALGENPNALLDQRDRQLDALARAVGGTIHEQETGSVSVSVGGFEVVRGTNWSTLEVGGTPRRLQTTDGTALVPGGQLGALLVEGNAIATQVIADLDAFAIDLRDSVNTQHNAGFDLSGAPGLSLFSGTSALNFAVASAIDADRLAASSSGAAADGNHSLAMAGLRTQSGVNGTLDEQARGIIGRVGSAVVVAQARADMNDSVLQGLDADRSSVSGVNLDEELTLLLQYQRSYEASARVLTSVDQMLDVLINRTGIVGR